MEELRAEIRALAEEASLVTTAVWRACDRVADWERGKTRCLI